MSRGLQRVRQDLVTEQQEQNLQTKGMASGSSGYKHRLGWIQLFFTSFQLHVWTKC